MIRRCDPVIRFACSLLLLAGLPCCRSRAWKKPQTQPPTGRCTITTCPAGGFNAAEKTLSPANVGRLVEKWRFPAEGSEETIGAVHATPTVVAGEVYFGTVYEPAFYKLSRDGKLLWIYRNTASE